jgi:hypothetical protein
MADWRLRLRAFVDAQFVVVVAVAVALAVAGGWVTYTTHVEPGTTTVERPASSWSTAGWFNHSATVTEENSVYPTNTTFRDRSVYFSHISPWMNGTYTFTYGASDGGSLSGRASVELLLRGVEQNEGETTVLWRATRELGTASDDALEPGETLTVPFAVNVNETRNRTRSVEEQLGNPPSETEMRLRATVEIGGTVNGGTVERTETYALPVSLDGQLYRPGSPGEQTDRHETTRTVTVERAYGPVRRVAGPALLGASLLGLGGLAVGRHRREFELDDRERRRLAYEDERDEFDEWISTIRLPREAFELPRAEATSLGELVDFAIDTDNGVVEDPDEESYYVRHDGYLYCYRPPPRSADGDVLVSEPAPRTARVVERPTDATSMHSEGEEPTDGTTESNDE